MSDVPVYAVVLAAGKGTRMKSPLPKVLHKVGGRSLVRHTLDSVRELGGGVRTALVLSPDMPEVEEACKGYLPDLSVVYQREQLGTGHAVKVALPEFDDADEGVLLVLYGDTPFVSVATLQSMVETISTDDECAAVVLGFEARDAGAYGRLVVDEGGEGRLLRIVEYNDASPEECAITLCNSGIIALRYPLVERLVESIGNDNAKGEYYLTDVVQVARDEGCGVRYLLCEESEVMGVNSQAERAFAEDLFQQHMRKKMLDDGVILVAPQTVYFSADTQVAPGSIIHPFVVFGDGVDISRAVEIKSFSHIDGTSMQSGCVVGPFARTRPGAVLEEDVHLGNFVEIKKSVVEKGAKINHLSYIGDARVGVGANVGAGTITCNYDGYNKHFTDIGAGAFIGSNTALVAPLSIGEGAIIGAGSVVTDDVPPAGLHVGGRPITTVEGYAEKYRERKKDERAG